MTNLEKYKEYKKKLEKLSYMSFIIGFDMQTDCPKRDKAHASDILNELEKEMMDIITSDEYNSLIDDLYNKKESLDDVTKLDIEIEYKNKMKLSKIPKDELFKHIENTSRSEMEWANARDTLDYSKFLIELEELVSYYKKYIKWQETDTLKGFDVILDEMEEGYTEAKYDEFFDLIERELVPFIKEILKCPKKYNTKLDNLKFDINKQRELTKLIADKMEYTNEVGCIRETIHPFTDWANSNDVRITTNYHEDLLFSNLYSVMHEIGHALFQMQMDPIYNGTNIFSNVTCITHESMSRFYENYLGRSKEFVSFLYPELLKLFPNELEGITELDIYNYVNSASAQLYRVEADELTYPIHVLIRYKIEKMLFHDEITVYEIGDKFNDLMEEYLGIRPTNLKEGAFQDVHWSDSFGYFPTYAIGSSFGIFYLEAMKKDIDLASELKKGSFKEINKWLKEHIHKYSGTRKNLEVVRYACGVEYDPNKYIEYLKDKFTKIYM